MRRNIYTRVEKKWLLSSIRDWEHRVHLPIWTFEQTLWPCHHLMQKTKQKICSLSALMRPVSLFIILLMNPVNDSLNDACILDYTSGNLLIVSPEHTPALSITKLPKQRVLLCFTKTSTVLTSLIGYPKISGSHESLTGHQGEELKKICVHPPRAWLTFILYRLAFSTTK